MNFDSVLLVIGLYNTWLVDGSADPFFIMQFIGLLLLTSYVSINIVHVRIDTIKSKYAIVIYH